MDTLQQFLARRETDLFRPNEVSEPLQMMYDFMKAALRHECDTLRITTAFVEWSIHGTSIGKFPLIHGKRSVFKAMRESLLAILERDKLAQQHFDLERFEDDELVYRVIHERL